MNKRWPDSQQKRIIFNRIGYNPFPIQARIHTNITRVTQIVGAEGGGKSHVTAAELCACMFWSDLIYLVGQTYDNTHQEFIYLSEHLMTLGAIEPSDISQPRQGSWVMTTQTGCRIVTLSVERGAASIIAKGEQPDIITLCEAGVIASYGVFLAAVRRARRTKGRVILVGTLRDDFGWYASLVDELLPDGNAWHGQTYSLPAWSNLSLYPGGETDPEIEYLRATMPPDEFSRTVAAEKVASRALIFPEFSYAQHVRPCPFDPSLPVHIWIDPGYFPSAYVVLPVQFYGPEVWLIDEIYLHQHEHRQVIDVARNRSWWPNVRRAVIDFAGRQHHAEASAIEVWKHHAGITPASQQIGILDGIARHRSFLGPTPRLFHDPKCTQTLAEYKQYKRPTDRDGNPTADMPVDKNNHAMKAIAYGLVDRFGFVERKPVPAGAVLAGAGARGWG